MLELYREFGSRPERTLSLADLEARGYSRNNAHVILSRFRSSGLAESTGPGLIRLLLPGEAQRVADREAQPRDPLVQQLQRMGAKATGFSVLPRRYPGPRPLEFILPTGKIPKIQAYLAEHHPERRVLVDAYEADDDAVCLYPGRVREEEARLEEALVHVYRHAPSETFALALQAVLQETTDLDWPWLRRRDEWPELAGIFVTLNRMAGRDVFPRFRRTEPPHLSYDALETIAQPLVARGA